MQFHDLSELTRESRKERMIRIVSQFPLCNYRAVPSIYQRNDRSNREGRGSTDLIKI